MTLAELKKHIAILGPDFKVKDILPEYLVPKAREFAWKGIPRRSKS